MGTPAGEIPAVLDLNEEGTELTGTLTDQNAVGDKLKGKVKMGIVSLKVRSERA